VGILGGPTLVHPIKDLVLGGACLSQTQDGDQLQLVVPVHAWAGGKLSLELCDDGMLNRFQHASAY
jgi:hypothetical protein